MIYKIIEYYNVIELSGATLQPFVWILFRHI